MDDISIKIKLDGAEQVQTGAAKAAEGLQRFGVAGAKAGQQVQLSGQQVAAISAQLQDFFVQIQGGQAPLTALLQQSSQLSSQFGGVGNAFRAVASLVTPAVAVFGTAAVALGGMAIAYHQGAAEAQAFGRALILSGNGADVTVGQLRSLARAQGELVGTEGQAAEALAALAATGKVTAASLGAAGEAVTRLARAGVPLKDTVKAFAELGQDPVKALLELNKAQNFLTAAVYEQVKALQEQGRLAEAAAVAQAEYARVSIDRAKQLEGQLGLLERMWKSVGDAAKSAWDKILNVGRPEGPREALRTIEQQIAAAEAKLAEARSGALSKDRPFIDADRVIRARERELVNLREQAAAQQELIRLEARSLTIKSDSSERERARIKWLEDGEKLQSKQQQAEQEIARIRTEGQQAGASQLEIEQRIAAVRAKYADTTGDNELAGLRAKLRETNAYIAALSQQDATTRQLNEGERTALKLREELLGNLSSTTRAEKGKALVLAEQLGVRERLAEDLKRDIETNQRLTAELGQQTDATRQRVAEQTAANAVMGKGRTAIEEMTLAQLRKSAADLEATNSVDPKYLTGLYARIEAQRAYVEVLRETDFKTMSAGLDEWLRSAEAQKRLLESEQNITGLTRLEREKLFAARQVELKLAKELADIDKAELNDAQKEKLRLQARAAARVESEAATAKVVRDDWARTSDQIEQSLTDALLRGFESGKGFAITLRDTVVNMFKTLVLRPILQPVVASFASLIGLGSVGPAAAAVQGGSSALSALGALGGLGSLVNIAKMGAQMTGWTGAGTGVALEGAGAMIGSGSIAQGVAQALGALAPWAGGAAAGVYGGRAISNGYSAWGSSGNRAVNVGTSIGAVIAGPIGAAVGGALGGLFNRAFGTKMVYGDGGITGSISAGDAMGQNYQDWTRKGGWFRSTKRGTDYSALTADQGLVLDQGAQAVFAQAQLWAKALSLPAEELARVTTSFRIKRGTNAEENQKLLDELFARYQEELAGRFQASLQPFQKAGEQLSATFSRLATLETFSKSLNTLGGVFSRLAGSSVDAREQLIALTGGMDALAQQAQGFVENYYSREEIAGIKASELKTALSQLGISALPNSRDEFRALVERLDPNSSAGREQIAALLQLQGSFATVADYLAETGLSLSQAAAQAPASDLLTPLLSTTSQQLQLAQQSMDAQMQTRDATLQVVQAVQQLTSAVQAGVGGWVSGYRQPEVMLAY